MKARLKDKPSSGRLKDEPSTGRLKEKKISCKLKDKPSSGVYLSAYLMKVYLSNLSDQG
jgi:hypothetical protein